MPKPFSPPPPRSLSLPSLLQRAFVCSSSLFFHPTLQRSTAFYSVSEGAAHPGRGGRPLRGRPGRIGRDRRGRPLLAVPGLPAAWPCPPALLAADRRPRGRRATPRRVRRCAPPTPPPPPPPPPPPAPPPARFQIEPCSRAGRSTHSGPAAARSCSGRRGSAGGGEAAQPCRSARGAGERIAALLLAAPRPLAAAAPSIGGGAA